MATRIDIEITSDRGDGTLTWRAAGAKQPKGVVAKGLLPAGAGVGDVLRAEAEFSVDGPELTSVMAPKSAKADMTDRLEMLGSGRSTQGVTTQLARKQRRGGGRDRGRGGGRGDGGARGDGRGRGSGGRGPGRGKPRQTLIAARTHREAWVASLPEGRRAIAEQLLHEGRDGVSAALDRQNKLAVDEGRDPIDVAPTMAIVDTLMPELEAAGYQDQLAAAIDGADKADLRELRKVYHSIGANVPVESRDSLRVKISARVDRDQAAWGREVREALSEGRVVRALQRSGRPPKAGIPLADDLVNQLCSAATEALSPDEEPHRWVAVIEALAGSPVRRLVRPESKPDDSSDELLDTVDRVAHLVPGVAEVLGIEPRPPRKTNRNRPRN